MGLVGQLQDYPDYWTKGETLEDLREHLRDLYADLTSGGLPGSEKSTIWLSHETSRSHPGD